MFVNFQLDGSRKRQVDGSTEFTVNVEGLVDEEFETLSTSGMLMVRKKTHEVGY